MKKVIMYFEILVLTVIDWIVVTIFTLAEPILLLLPNKLYYDFGELTYLWIRPMRGKLDDLHWELKDCT